MSDRPLIPLTVISKDRLTDECVALTFDLPTQWQSVFDYKPGQYLTLEFEIEGHRLRRAYSLCSSPVADDLLQIGVKRVDGGVVSNHIHDTVEVGDQIKVLPPMGEFYAECDAKARRSYYLFAAGSGITPILSILRTVLDTEPYSHIYLLYGSRDEEHIIFEEQLNQLAEAHSDRFTLVHTLSQPTSHKWSALLSTREYWKGSTGRVDTESVTTFINENPPQAHDAGYYICGPGTMIESVQDALRNLDVADNDIHIEHFGSAETPMSHINGQAASIVARFEGQELQADVSAKQTLLEGMLDAGHEVPNSCQSGVCGQCKAQLNWGEVSMRSHIALSDDEVKDGMILCCQSVAKSDVVEIEFS